MKCCCCGADAGWFKQWWNRDKGYGICRSCVEESIRLGETAEQIEHNYGKEGVHYAAGATGPSPRSFMPI
jgi:hypothetical protein